MSQNLKFLFSYYHVLILAFPRMFLENLIFRSNSFLPACQELYCFQKYGNSMDLVTGDGGFDLVAQMEAAGFVFEGASNVNANPNDQPQEGDVVWRLPPTLMGSRDNPEAAAAMQAIGESNRMTLKFRKPAA